MNNCNVCERMLSCCTNGRCYHCHLECCTDGGATSPGHGRIDPKAERAAFLAVFKGYSVWATARTFNRLMPGIDWRKSSKKDMAAEWARRNSVGGGTYGGHLKGVSIQRLKAALAAEEANK